MQWLFTRWHSHVALVNSIQEIRKCHLEDSAIFVLPQSVLKKPHIIFASLNPAPHEVQPRRDFLEKTTHHQLLKMFSECPQKTSRTFPKDKSFQTIFHGWSKWMRFKFHLRLSSMKNQRELFLLLPSLICHEIYFFILSYFINIFKLNGPNQKKTYPKRLAAARQLTDSYCCNVV